MMTMRRHWRFNGFRTAAAAVIAAALGVAVWYATPAEGWLRLEAGAVDGLARERTPPAVSIPPSLRSAALRGLANYRAARPKRASDHFHRWRFEALTAPFPANPDLRHSVEQLVTRRGFAKTFPDSPLLFFQSPLGWEVRQRLPGTVREGWEFEHHLDQFLASCAEIKAPLGLAIETRSGTVTLGELLDASRRNFEPGQESCWSLVAYAAYLPHEPRWQNRLGEPCSYEAIVRDLLFRPLDAGSCAGTHKQYAIASLIGRTAAGDFLQPALRRECTDYLRRASASLEKSQEANGAWTPAWANGSKRASHDDGEPLSVHDRVRITGHHLEWIDLAPESVRPSTRSITAAVAFLVQALDHTQPATMQKEYCGYSHAAGIVERIVRRNARQETVRRNARIEAVRGNAAQHSAERNPRGDNLRPAAHLEKKNEKSGVSRG